DPPAGTSSSHRSATHGSRRSRHVSVLPLLASPCQGPARHSEGKRRPWAPPGTGAGSSVSKKLGNGLTARVLLAATFGGYPPRGCRQAPPLRRWHHSLVRYGSPAILVHGLTGHHCCLSLHASAISILARFIPAGERLARS